VSEAVLPISLDIVTLSTILAPLVLLYAMGVEGTAHAESAAGCKICRDQHRACVQAHSQAACKTELDFCLKTCAKK